MRLLARLTKLEKAYYLPEISEELKEDADRLSKSFKSFVKDAWSIIEGGKLFVDNWSVGAICEHLEAVHRLEIKKLIINVPPRTSKSSLIAIMWPVWTWTIDPGISYLCLSHSHKFSLQHAIKSRDILTSDWYLSRWSNLFTLKADQNTQERFVNTKRGFRESSGILNKLTGKGADRIIIDDPNDTEEYPSETLKVNEKFSGRISTRTNNPSDAVWVLDQQRTREKDLTGHVLVDGDWVVLCLPMEYESSRRCKTIILPSTNGKVWEDPRTTDGELLWPQRFNKDYLDKMKNRLGSYRYAGQYQQRPSPEEGGYILKKWFKLWDRKVLPEIVHVIQSWDTAMDDKDSDCYSACTTWGIFYDDYDIPNLMLLSLWRDKVQYPQLRRMAKQLYNDYRHTGVEIVKPSIKYRPNQVLIEYKVSGISLAQDLQQAKVPVTRFNPNRYGDKVKRVRIVSHLIESGRVWVPTASPTFNQPTTWANLLIEECGLFPNGEYRDLVDTMTQVLLLLNSSGWIKNPDDSVLLEMEYERSDHKLSRNTIY